MKQSPNFPFSPRQFPFFYGWVILLVGVVGIIASAPGQTIGVSVFTDYLIEATGLSRLEVSNSYLVGTLLSASMLPFGGKLLDRIGSRNMAVIAAVGLGLSILYLSINDHVARYLRSSTMFFLSLTLSFLGVRFFGQGLLTMTSRTMIAKWFDKKRGLVSSIQGTFVVFTFSMAPNFFNQLIGSEHQWRTALVQIALFIGIGGTLFFWLFYRDTPEACGLSMDGTAAGITSMQHTEAEKLNASQRLLSKEVHGNTRAEAMRTLTFWAISLPLTLHALTITGFTFHIESIGHQVGLDRDTIVKIFIPIAFVSVFFGFIIGFISDHIHLKYLFIFMSIGLSFAMLSTSYLGESMARKMVILGFGISGGCFFPLSAVALPRFFGRLHLGAIAGIQTMCIVAGSALGPSLFALVNDYTGSYKLGFVLTAGIAAAAVVPLLLVDPKLAQAAEAS